MVIARLKLLLVTVVAALVISGCTATQYAAKNEAFIEANAGATIEERLSSLPEKSKIDAPVYKDFSVLDHKYVTITSPSVPVSVILYTISRDLGLNLIIEPGLDIEGTVVTVNFTNTPIEEALDVVMDLADMFYSINGNVLVVKRYETVHYSIPYIPAVAEYTSTLGGDVLGGASGGDSGGSSSSSESELTGEFSIEYSRPEGSSDFYSEIERNLVAILGGGAVEVSEEGSASIGSDEYYTLNRTTGTLSIKTTKSKLNRVNDFFDKVFAKAKRQVLIEARIVDVVLSDNWEYGIDWNAVIESFTIGQTVTNLIPTPLGTAGSVGFVDPSGNFNATLSIIGQFGNSETLANPRMMVLNGQTALITAGTITPYWEEESDTSTTTAGSVTSSTFTKTNVLEGVMLGVTPFINDDGTITMNIVPVSTSIESEKQNMVNNVSRGSAPVVNIKEAGTIVDAADGATIVMGGMMTTTDRTDISKIPLLGDIPYLGYLFRSEKQVKEKRELVIFVKPTIVYTDGDRN